MRKATICLALLLLMGAAVTGHDYVPAAKQTNPIMLKGGTLFTISGPVLENNDLLLENGRITQIGPNLTPPDNTEVIDVTGKHVYPGLIAAGTSLGLVEIGAVHATSDSREVGRVNPDVQSIIAYNPDSEVIPTVRSNGIAYAQIVPSGSILRGGSCLLNLDAWTREDAAEKHDVGIHLSWPSVAVSTGWWVSQTPEEQKKEMAESRVRLKEIFDDARAYCDAKQANPALDVDSRWQSMMPVIYGEMRLFVHAGDYRQIEQAIDFAREQNIKIVIVGGREAWKITDLLVANDIPVIYGNSHGLPMRHDDDYDMAFKIPGLLAEAGVNFCLGSFSATGVRNLPFDAGQAVAYGLDKAAALRSITLSAAEIMGVEADLGSLEVGKKASVIVSDGDILDHLTHNVTHMFIEGRQIDLNNKQKELWHKYSVKKLD